MIVTAARALVGVMVPFVVVVPMRVPPARAAPGLVSTGSFRASRLATSPSLFFALFVAVAGRGVGRGRSGARLAKLPPLARILEHLLVLQLLLPLDGE